MQPLPDGPLARRADDVFARTSPYPGQGLKNHCLRLYHYARMLMAARGERQDPQLTYFLAIIHDLGLVSEQDAGVDYLSRTCALFRRETAGLDLRRADPREIDQCLRYNHRLLPVPGLTPQAETFRQAVWIEHTRGLRTYGLDPAAVAEVNAAYPRDNLDSVLWDFARRVLASEPGTIVHGIFF
jgi:hypothetical protein